VSRGSIAPVSAIADVLALWGRDGWLTPPLRAIVPVGVTTIGPVRTIAVEVADRGNGMSKVYDVVSSDLSGRFVVVAGASQLEGAMWGEILSIAAQANGAAGAVVDGAVRDRPEIEAIGFATYGLDERVVGPYGTAHVTALDEPVTIAGVAVDPDDHIVADATGIVRLRGAEIDDVLAAAGRYAAAEEQVVQALRDGEPLTSAYRYKKSVVDELRR
jgi:regulator of RNase E activity RraA